MIKFSYAGYIVYTGILVNIQDLSISSRLRDPAGQMMARCDEPSGGRIIQTVIDITQVVKSWGMTVNPYILS